MKYLALAALMAATPALAQSAKDYLEACKAGNEEACLTGTQYAQRDGQEKLMVQFADLGCGHGFVISCSDRGMFHLTGIGGPKNVKKAVPLIIKGCQDGYYRACTNLGFITYTGQGVAQDSAKAASYYKLGCDGGSGPACTNLGLMHRDGDGVPQSNAKAIRLFDRACDLGDQRAC